MTEKQRTFIEEISKTLGIKFDLNMTKKGAYYWIQKHVPDYWRFKYGK